MNGVHFVSYKGTPVGVNKNMNKVHKMVPMVKKRIDNHEQILVAPETIIAKRGAPALTVRDAAAAAKTSFGGVYRFFEDLDALVIAVAQRTLARFKTTLAATGGSDPRTETYVRSYGYLAFAGA